MKLNSKICSEGVGSFGGKLGFFAGEFFFMLCKKTIGQVI
jgi:hypothetical protein